MISENQLEQLTERIVERTQQANTYFLKKMGETIKKFRTLTPSQAHQLEQILRYGEDYNDIIRRISQITELNVKEIDEIFKEFAKKDQQFYKQFYEYRNKPFMPYEKNDVLQKQVKALATITKQEMYNFSRTNLLGYSLRDMNGNIVFKGLKETYNRILDEAVLNVGQGVDTFDNAMSRIMKELGQSGIKKLDFANGRSVRLDSMTRQYIQGALRNLHNETMQEYGKEFNSDGVEISVHMNPAPDHEEVQGRQFSNEEFDRFQNDIDAIDYSGKLFPSEFEGHDRRSISEYNCYHYVFPIILGVSKPVYSDKQLQEIIDKNEKGFEIDGKHYSLYDGEQLLRKVELELRKSKDTQILAHSSNNVELVWEMQSRITQLTSKYRDILKASGLKSKIERAKVSGYRRVNVAKMK